MHMYTHTYAYTHTYSQLRFFSIDCIGKSVLIVILSPLWFKFTIGYKQSDVFIGHNDMNIMAVLDITSKIKHKIVSENLRCTPMLERKVIQNGGILAIHYMLYMYMFMHNSITLYSQHSAIISRHVPLCTYLYVYWNRTVPYRHLNICCALLDHEKR